MSFEIKSATQDDLSAVSQFLQPFMNAQHLLQRTSLELQLLLRHGFKVETTDDDSIVGFCALEIYSKKLAECAPSQRRKCIGAVSDIQFGAHVQSMRFRLLTAKSKTRLLLSNSKRRRIRQQPSKRSWEPQ